MELTFGSFNLRLTKFRFCSPFSQSHLVYELTNLHYYSEYEKKIRRFHKRWLSYQKRKLRSSDLVFNARSALFLFSFNFYLLIYLYFQILITSLSNFQSVCEPTKRSQFSFHGMMLNRVRSASKGLLDSVLLVACSIRMFVVGWHYPQSDPQLTTCLP